MLGRAFGLMALRFGRSDLSAWPRGLWQMEGRRSELALGHILRDCDAHGFWRLPLLLLHATTEVNAICLTSAISSFARAGAWGYSLELLLWALESQLEPNTVTYNAAAAACDKGSQWHRSLQLFEDLPAKGVEEDAWLCWYRPQLVIKDLASYNGAISACGRRFDAWQLPPSLSPFLQGHGVDLLGAASSQPSCAQRSHLQQLDLGE